jgi:hypothetical protein
MIMFRHKIGGQVAVTVYNTIPNVVLGLILVTFSFSIAGLILNVSALVLNIISGVLGITPENAINMTNLGSLIESMVTGSAGQGLAGAALVGGGVLGIIASITLGLSGFLWLFGLGVLLVFIFIFGIYIFAFIKVWWVLFKSYLAILIDVVAGPIILTVAVFPGNSKMMTGWFNRLLRNSLLFPMVFAVINASMLLKTDINIDMNGLMDGTLATGTSGGVGNLTMGLVKMILPLAAMHFAAQLPGILEEWFPSQGSQGLGNAMKGVQGSLGKIPFVGSLLGGGK